MEAERVVVDTNVFISALLGQNSYPYKIIAEIILRGTAMMCLSTPLLEEYGAVSKREKFARIPGFSPKAAQLTRILVEIAFFIEPQDRLTELADDADNRLLELALAADAGIIITGNSRHFTFKEFQGVKIFSPREYYEMVML